MLHEILVSYPAQLFAVAFFLWLWGIRRNNRRSFNPKNLPLPPGPKRYPIIGSILSWPTTKYWLRFEELFEQYGSMVYFELLGMHILVLGSLDTVHDLLEKRSRNYSDREQSVMLLDLMDWDYNLGLHPYGTWWRRNRRAFHQYFTPNAVINYQPIQIRESRALLRRLLTSPDDFRNHIRHTFGAIIMDVAYGIRIQESNDRFIRNVELAVDGGTIAAVPGRFMVDFFPFLKHVPSWAPGAGFKRFAAYYRSINESVRNDPFNHVKEQMRQGVAMSSVASKLLQRLPYEAVPGVVQSEDEKIAQNTAAVAYVGGADTTVSSLSSFFLAMVLYPEVQKKAQDEIDRIVGVDRLPDFSHRERLPYISAIAKEAMRWQMVLPVGVPHKTIDADEYGGYYIPKGTLVFTSSWRFLHDPKVFHEPERFQPERYLKDGKIDPLVRDPHAAAFGYGRRICPGRYMSDHSLFITVASVLATYSISPALDKDGNPIMPTPEVTEGLLTHPVKFDCIIKPRSAQAERLIKNSAV